jgi:hypothetical protein
MPGAGEEMAEGAGTGELAPTHLPQYLHAVSGRAYSIFHANMGCEVPENAAEDLESRPTCYTWPPATPPRASGS